MKENTKMSPPWHIYYRKLEALFGGDPEIHMSFDDENKVITMRVENSVKATTLANLLPTEKAFGAVTVKINIVPANDKMPMDELLTIAFEGNPAFHFAVTETGAYNNPITFVVFDNKVVQFFVDDLCDYYGQRSTLYEVLARELLNPLDGVYYNTDIPGMKITRSN